MVLNFFYRLGDVPSEIPPEAQGSPETQGFSKAQGLT